MIKVTFTAFDRELTEYFPDGTDQEAIIVMLRERCFTVYNIRFETINT